ncbi:hypothetical protein KY330_05985 [Candidatus Woesearchaeota archaeon]|nr:hypothetical protein [Candidatus Woesearchaeota archaeon]
MKSYNLNNITDLQFTISKALYNIDSFTGIRKLSLSERCALKNYCIDAISRWKDVQHSPRHSFGPAEDAACLFLKDFYGILIQTQLDGRLISDYRLALYEKYGYDKFGEDMRLEQESRNLI